MLGRRAAAAADELHAELEHAPREDAEVLGRRDVDEALVDAARKAGVGHRRDREPEREQLLDRREHVHRPVGAVDADDVAPRSFRRLAHGGDRGAVGHASSSSTET